ncbi:MAG TPA: exopolysaccharide biosynthesis polyprenyl glycosylphosphotransferase [Allosphingosinicella sp.]|nr:exopolysaccharide biosynthesis polyprenyl glycosylphosphotransferase [Allosphingosinicella sp.]
MASSSFLIDDTANEALVLTPPAEAEHHSFLSAINELGTSKELLRLKLYASLIAIDAGGLILAFMLASAIRLNDPFHGEGIDMMLVMLPLFIGIAVNSRAYSIDVLQAPRIGVRKALQSLLFALAAVIGIIFYLKASESFSRLMFAIGSGFAVLFVGFGRWGFGQLIGRRLNWRFINEVLLVDGTQVFPRQGEIVLFANEMQLTPRTDDPELLDRIGRLLKNCDRVLVACPAERRAAWSAMLKGTDVDVEVLVPELDGLGALDLRRFGGRSSVLVGCGPLGLRDRVAKRALDLAIALPAFLLLLPLMVAVAVAIKLESAGPCFFRQPRVGRGNRIFQLVKFRSMRIESSDHAGTRSASRDDDRVTRVGAFIRRTSIDELPQLINVLMGDMSIVGPRPHALASTAEDQLFWTIDPRYWDRHAIKPGMTGLAQIRGYRGATSCLSDLTNRLQADLEYLSGWSIGRDVAIIFRTLRVMAHRNAF